MGAELGVGYISIVPEVSKISPGIAKALEATQSVADKQGQGMGSKLSGGIAKTLKVGALTTGAAVGTILGGSIAKGMGRLTAIEGAQAKLSGLGNDAKTVAGVMDNALASVKGTAHGLGEAASTAAGMVAAGIKPGQELGNVLKTVGDTAAIAGRSMEDVGLIFGSVAARGKLQGDDMLQLMSSGIPVLQLLSKELGVSSAEVSQMVSKGKIDFATFEKAMREGVGGAALEMGNTFQGATANFGAALGRLGATGLKPFFDISKDGLNSATQAVDALEGRLKPVSSGVAEFLQKRAVPAVKDLGQSLAELKDSSDVQMVLGGTVSSVKHLVEAGKELAPTVSSIAVALGKASAAVGISSWAVFTSTMDITASTLQAVTPALETVSKFLADHPALVTAAVAAWTGFKTLPAATDKVSSALQFLNDRVGGTTDGLHQLRPAFSKLKDWSKETGAGLTGLDIAMQAVGDRGSGVMQTMAQSYTQAVTPLREVSMGYKNLAKDAKSSALASKDAFTSFDFVAQQAGRSVQGAVTGMAATMKGVGAAAFTGLRSAASGAMELFGGPWGVALAVGAGAAFGVVNAISEVKTTQETLAKASREAASAQMDLNVQLAGTTGALTEQGLATAAKLAAANLAEFTAVGKQLQVSWKDPTSWINMDPLVSFSERMKMTGEELRAHQKALRNTSEGYGSLDKALKNTGISQESLGRVVAEGGADYEKLRSSLMSMGESGQFAAQKLAENRQQVLDSITAARELDPAFAGISKAVGVLADESSSASDKLNALKNIMDELTGKALSQDEAQAKLVGDVQKTTEAIEKMSGKLAEVGPIALDPDGTIKATTAAGKEAVDMVSELANTMLTAASNGVPVDEIFSQQEKNLVALQKALGLTDSEFKGLMESYGLTRDLMALPLELKGAETADQQVAALSQRLSTLGEGKTIKIPPPDPAVLVALEQIGFKVENLPNGKVEITSTAAVAEADLKNLQNKVNEIDGKHVKATADLDTTPFALSVEQAKTLGKSLDGLVVSPEADLVIEKLLQGKEISMGELELLSREKALPIADLEKKLLDAGVEDAKAKLAEIPKKTEPEVSVSLGDSLINIKKVLNALAKLPASKGISLTARIMKTAITGNARGGIAGYKDGGKLPVTGPGTNMVDGILGINDYGMPVARVNAGEWVINRKSSQDYHDVLKQINAGTFPRYENGGIILRSAEQIKEAVAPLDGTPYSMGGWSLAGTDCSGGVSATVNAAFGLPIFDSRMSTVTIGQWLAAKGALPGDGGPGDIRVGWWDKGGGANGHTAIQIQDGTFIESGGNTGGGFTIGRGAGPLDGRGFDQFAHFPGGEGEISMSADPTSHIGASSRGNADFGKANDLYETAYKHLKRNAQLFDIGGVWGSGTMGRNESGKNELVLTNQQWGHLSETARAIFGAGGQISTAARDFARAAEMAQGGFAASTRHFGGSWLGQSEIVQDAEKGLRELRKQFVDETSAIAEAERELAQARREVSKSDRDIADRIADREEAVRKAREGDKKGQVNAEALAKAERELAKAREDAPDKSRAALKKLEAAEQKVHDAREKVADQGLRLEAAERAISGARLKAASEFASQVTEHIVSGFNRVGAFFDELGRLAGIVDKTRQATSKLEMQQQTNLLERVKALQELQLKEWDMVRARAQGAMSVARAEQELEDARNKAAMMGATSIEAMRGAMDRFYRTGVFAVEEVAASVVENSRLVKAAEWGVQKAKAQTALDTLEAAQAQKLAQFAVLEATLKQTSAAQLLQAHTEALQKQTAQLHGLTANQATGAGQGFSGVGKILGGIGKFIAGALMTAGGFAVGGPMGALPGLAMIGAGIGDTTKGAIDVHHNKKEMGGVWKNLDAGSKAGIIIGSMGGAALSIAGGVGSLQYGAEMGAAGAKLGEQIFDATLGGVQHNLTAKVEKAQRDLEDRISAINHESDVQNLNLALGQATNRVDYLKEKDRLTAELEYAKLKEEMEKSDSERVRAALEAAANVEKLRASSEKTGELQVNELQKLNASLEQLLEVTKHEADASGKARLASTNQLVGALSAVDSVAFDRARL